MKDRYRKQELFIGKDGQAQVENSKIVLIGMGALGSASAEMLVRAGIGELVLIDRDYVEFHNLQRQQLYTEQDAASYLPKAFAARERLQAINQQVTLHTVIENVDHHNIEHLIEGADVIVDATDNFETRLIINDAALKHSIPYLYGACVGSYGITYPVLVDIDTPCLHCLLEQLPQQSETCDTAGIISPIVQWVAAMQVTQALRILCGQEVKAELCAFDIWTGDYTKVDVNSLRNSSCSSCGTNAEFPFLNGSSRTRLDVLCGREAVHIRPSANKSLDLPALSEEWANALDQVTANEYLLAFQYKGHRIVLFADGRAIIHGVADISRARSLYDSLVG
ncbi:ThiF family adenylyltransferase [Terribacillus saccharophilus]|uniref:Thiamine biosynthesis protein MoeB n=1 Tax=Terribacillus saccharophilus TaxID=361277 RepID=A0ABX4GUG0_9BACI|nr:ThiF family adenylyltransferase [Terribacillus saccharophilus]PAD34024.1 thiamine biosynthesis protein MoeB [Terribacillus saccharophilus]PAD94731.1 thiamine biosynthesis protein MoeB [Terribacillus saccharophilus]PAD98497.1 thiamine biosynthesis protein MoeB [Terribacillus saccharophilus]